VTRKNPRQGRGWESGFNGGGAKGGRTPDLGIANAALYQLSYRPTVGGGKVAVDGGRVKAKADENPGPGGLTDLAVDGAVWSRLA
jgi:hypothetical protein